MTYQSYKKASSDIRRLINYSFINTSGHFARKAVQTPGQLNNWWFAIYNIKNGKLITLYKVKNNTLIFMYRKKSPYYTLIQDVLYRRQGAKMVLSKRIPKEQFIRSLNHYTYGMRAEGKSKRRENNAKLELHLGRGIYDRTTSPDRSSTTRATPAS